MPTVETTNGPIDVEQLGLTLIHEHFFSSDEAVSVQWPHVRDREREYELALESAGAVKRHGVTTVVEPTAMLLGRDVPTLQRLAKDTGLHIVACTGIYTYDHPYLGELLDQVVYIGMDRYGLDLFLPTERRNATVAELLDRGHAERMFLSQDFDIPIANGLDWYPPEMVEQFEAAGAARGWSMTLLFEEVIPSLKEAGMTDDQL